MRSKFVNTNNLHFEDENGSLTSNKQTLIQITTEI